MRRKKHILMLGLVLFSLFVQSCDVHEFPLPPVPFVLHLDYDTDMPLHKVVEHDQPTRAAAQEQYDVRYVVKVFDGNKADSRETLYDFVFTKDDISVPDSSLTVTIPRGDYRFVIWSDYVLQGTDADLFYRTDVFDRLTLSDGEHAGSTDMRDAFLGSVTARVSADCAEATVAMARPLAKFNFVSTDLDEFLSRTDDESLENYTVMFRYNGFMPSVYNPYTLARVSAETGVSFRSTLKQLESGEAELGFDYVFADDSESCVSVSVEIYDAAGKMLSRFRPVDVPLVRSRLTTVKAAFLTSEAGGGVSVSPDYEGNHTIVIK